MKARFILAVLLAVSLVFGLSSSPLAQRTMSDQELRSAAPGPLKKVKVSEPPNLKDFLKNKKEAIEPFRHNFPRCPRTTDHTFPAPGITETSGRGS